jgi:hypothetical protein
MSSSVSPEMDSLRASNRSLAAELKLARLALGDIGEVMQAVRDEVIAEPAVRIPVPKDTRPSAAPVTYVSHITDWHIGLVTPESMVEGFNRYDWETAQRRVAQLSASIGKHAAVMQAGYNVDECVILATGDYISGDIHEGLVRTNEFQTPKQAVRAGRLFAAYVRSLAGVFPKVRVEFVAPGNHDRLTRKPQAQAGGENSWGYVVGALAEDLLANQKNVDFRLHTAMQALVEAAGRKYLIGHGDGILGTWGIPFYGIDRKVGREAKARRAMPDRQFDRIVIGHFHTGTDHEDWLIGGSLSGTDENDHKCGRHSKAHQTSWATHPKHGEFGFTRWYLD